MRTIAAVALLIGMFAAAGAGIALAAENYANDAKRFALTVPDGWTAVPGNAGPVDLALISPRFDQTSGLCIVVSKMMTESRHATQAALNDEMEKGVDEAFWRAIVEDKSARDTTVEQRSELRSGRRVFLATVRQTMKLGQEDTPMRMELALHVVPGLIMMGQCGANQAQFSAEQNDIKTVTDTLNPTAGVIASLDRPQGSSTLVLFAGPRFDGDIRELAHDAPDLRLGHTASFALRGAQQWEICDRANYQGNCRFVAGASAAAFGGRPLAIASARRVAGRLSAVGVAAEAGAVLMKSARERMVTRQR